MESSRHTKTYARSIENGKSDVRPTRAGRAGLFMFAFLLLMQLMHVTKSKLLQRVPHSDGYMWGRHVLGLVFCGDIL